MLSALYTAIFTHGYIDDTFFLHFSAVVTFAANPNVMRNNIERFVIKAHRM